MPRPSESERDEVRPSGRPPIVQRRPSPDDFKPPVDVEASISPITGVSTTGFGANGGEVMGAPRVFAIYWGRDYGSPTIGMNARAHNLDGFFGMLMTSRYLDMLAQYQVGKGAFLGSTWVDYAPGNPKTRNFDEMRDVLIDWLDDGLTPEVPTWDEKNLLFVIFPPTDVMLTDNDGGDGFCGYHWYGHYHNAPAQKANLFFAVVDTTADTSAVGHELSEAFTDRNLNGWRSGGLLGAGGVEIADVCSSCGSPALTLGGFAVASYWLVDANRCLQQPDLTPAPPVPAAVPQVIGMAPGDAVRKLGTAGFLVHETDVVDSTCEHIGVVTGQSPRAGTASLEGSTVTIWVGKRGPHPCP